MKKRSLLLIIFIEGEEEEKRVSKRKRPPSQWNPGFFLPRGEKEGRDNLTPVLDAKREGRGGEGKRAREECSLILHRGGKRGRGEGRSRINLFQFLSLRR